MLLFTIVALQACKTYFFRSNYRDINSLLYNTNNSPLKPFLKAHLKNGDVCILKDSWQVDTMQNTVLGKGIRYNFNRNQTFDGNMSIPIDSVAIFETNDKIKDPERGRIATLSILLGVELLLGIICVSNPKACFGSCPTFYMNEEDNFHYADSEGFSSAISPSMEYADIDAINYKPKFDSVFSITMKNEALETHCVNEVKILAYPKGKDEHIYQSPKNDFYLCENNYLVSKAYGNEGDISELVKCEDRQERFSLTDENNLKSKEEIYLLFDGIKNYNDLGLVINFRQTLLPTYLFYSAMGYMGDQVGDIFSILETDKEMQKNFDASAKALGNIDIYLWDAQKNNWELQGNFNETGPIAMNRQILPLQNLDTNSNIKIKIVLNKGLWRIDYLSLTNIKKKVNPIEISPNSILNKGMIDPNALTSINDPAKYLISMPGSEYKFNFKLPKGNSNYELFLYSKGYYLEWMRQHWIKDKDLLKLRQMVKFPNEYLTQEAKAYKGYEANMEQEFWNSKIDTKKYSYNEKH